MPAWRRKVLVAGLTCVAILGAIYLVVCTLFVAYEPAFVFAQVPRHLTPQAAGLKGFGEVTVTTEDGVPLVGWWRPPEPGHGAIVFLTGTGVVLSDYGGLFADLAGQGFGVLGIDYRGNGGSPGVPSEAGWRADARAAFDYVRAAAPQAKIAVFGESMGTGFAVGLAVERPASGVLLNSAYASVARLFEKNGMPLLRGVPFPASLLMKDPVDSVALIGRLSVPVLILHGTEDWAIPIGEARRLYAAAHPPKELIEVPGAGHVAVWFGPYRERALQALAEWTRP